MDKPRDLKLRSGVKHQKIFHMCPGVFQNLNQGPLDGAAQCRECGQNTKKVRLQIGKTNYAVWLAIHQIRKI